MEFLKRWDGRLSVHLGFVFAVAALADQRRRAAHKASVLIAPLHNFHVAGGFGLWSHLARHFSITSVSQGRANVNQVGTPGRDASPRRPSQHENTPDTSARCPYLEFFVRLACLLRACSRCREAADSWLTPAAVFRPPTHGGGYDARRRGAPPSRRWLYNLLLTCPCRGRCYGGAWISHRRG